MIFSGNHLLKAPFIASLILLLCLTAAPGFAADFGLSIDGSGSVEANLGDSEADPATDITAKATAWGNTAIGSAMNLEVAASYKYNTSRPVLIEIDQLQLGGTSQLGGGFLNYRAGRIQTAEFSGKVFSHTGDGLAADMGLAAVTVSAFAVYAGLLQSPANSIVMTLSDSVDQSTGIADPAPAIGPLGSSRLIEGLSLSFPELFLEQTLIVSGVFQQDLRSTDRLTDGGGRLHSNYAGLGLSGPLACDSRLFYQIYGYGIFGSVGDDSIIGGMGGGSLNFLMPQFLGSSMSLEVLYSSGDADSESFYEGNTDGSATQFMPITASPAAVVFTPQQSNLVTVSGSWSLRPMAGSSSQGLRNIMLLLKPVAFFRSTTGPISAAGVDSEAASYYLGTEIDLMIMARPLSDLGLSLGGGLFIPSDQMTDSSVLGKISASVSLTL